MSRKAIHLKIDVPFTKRLAWLFSRGTIDILMQPSAMGSITVRHVLLSGRDPKLGVKHGVTQPH